MSTSSAGPPQLGRALNDATLGLFALGILLVAVVVWTSHGENVERTDFALTYVGAHIVHTGLGRNLYDINLQVQLRNSMFEHASPLYFEHPPFEALALSPLAAFSFRSAYLVWGLCNVALLVVLIVSLRPYFQWPHEDLGYLFMWLLFAPIAVSLYQGQSSIFVLAAYAMAFIQMKKENAFAAGAAFGLGLLKFQFALPFGIILLFRKQWRFVGGFVTSGGVLAVASVIAVGWEGTVDYIHLLLQIGNHPKNLSYGSAVDMPTLHGLFFALAGSHLNSAELNGVVALVSLALLGWIAWQWNTTSQSASFDLMFAVGVAASLLCGSHMFTHDFSPLVLSMFLVAARLQGLSRRVRLALVFTLVLFWAFPLYFLFVKWHCLYLMSIVLITFVWAGLRGAESNAGRVAGLAVR